MRQTVSRFLCFLTLLSILAGCTGAAPIQPLVVEQRQAVIDTSAPTGEWVLKAPEANPKRGGILKTAWGANPTHFDIHQGGGCAGCGMMYDGLVMWNIIDGYRTIVPALATSWSASDDQLVYTFKLREGVKFHDGAPFSADDVLATFNRIITPPEGIAIAGIKEELSMVKEISCTRCYDGCLYAQDPHPLFHGDHGG